MRSLRAYGAVALVASVCLLAGCATEATSPVEDLATSSPATTESVATSNVVFAVEADPHMDERSDAQVFSATIAQINARTPSFLIDLGDIFMVDKLAEKSDADIRDRYVLMKDFYDQLDPSIPLHFAMGNHDGEAGWDKLNTHPYREEYFPAQTRELNYYSFEQGGSLMVVLDPFSYTDRKPNEDGWGWTLGSEQYEWLAQTLASSSAEHKFVFIHHLVGGNNQGRGGVEWADFFEWGGRNLDGTDGFYENRPGWAMPIHDLLTSEGVDIVFKGHDHFYAHQELDGLTYQTLPQPSHPGSKLNEDPEKFGYISGKVVGGSGFLLVQTTNEEISVTFVSSDGAELDRYIVPGKS